MGRWGGSGSLSVHHWQSESEPDRRSKTAAYLHEELTNRANGPGHQYGDRHVH